MPPERPEGASEKIQPLNNHPLWQTLTKERLEGFHSWLNRAVFNQIRSYKHLAELTVHRKKPKIKEDPSKPSSYEDRLKEYNSFYRLWQYFHAIQIPYWLYLCSQYQIEQNNDKAPLLETSAVIINTLLAFHIAYNRRRVRRIIDAVEKRDERREERAEVRARNREKRRRKKERQR